MEIHGNKDSYFFKGVPKEQGSGMLWFEEELKISFNSGLMSSKYLNLHKYCVLTNLCGGDEADDCLKKIYLAALKGDKPNITTIEELQRLAFDIIKGIQELEKAGFYHNDIAERNIMQFDDDGEKKYKLIDFGQTKEGVENMVQAAPADTIALAWVDEENMEQDVRRLRQRHNNDFYALILVIYNYLKKMPNDKDVNEMIGKIDYFFNMSPKQGNPCQPNKNWMSNLSTVTPKDFITKLFDTKSFTGGAFTTNFNNTLTFKGGGRKSRRGGGRKSRRGGVKKTRQGGGRMSRLSTRKKKK